MFFITLITRKSPIVLAVALIWSASNFSFAAKGGNGNGGGKPGGEDPPPAVAPVTYSVTTVAMPGSNIRFYEHDNQGAMVGSVLDAPPGGRRALAYLPTVFPNAIYLDDPVFGLEVPDGWHTRSAVDINNHGTIVGNMELNAAPDTDVRPMYITGTTSGIPELHSFDQPFHPNAWHEVVTSINDSGDMLVWSQERLPDESTIDRLYVGNPGLYGQTAMPFVEIDFASQGFLAAQFGNTQLSLGERQPDGTFYVGGGIRYEGQEPFGEPFRANSDGSVVEIGNSYVQDDGSEIEWYGATTSLDMNDTGDIAGNAIIRPAKQGKLKNNFFAALWAVGSDEFVSATGEDRFQTEYDWARLNNDGDYIVSSPYGIGADAFWHADWSTANGPIQITDLIDPNDPNRDLFYYAHEITDRDSTDWPTILAQGTQIVDGVEQSLWLALTPSLSNSTTISSTAVPEPQSLATVSCCLLGSLLARRRQCSVQPSLVKNCN